MCKLAGQLWTSLKCSIVRGSRRPRRHSMELGPVSLRQEKLPKIVRDEEAGIVHEFRFTQDELNRADILRKKPHPKLKRDAYGQTVIQDSWGV